MSEERKRGRGEECEGERRRDERTSKRNEVEENGERTRGRRRDIRGPLTPPRPNPLQGCCSQFVIISIISVPAGGTRDGGWGMGDGGFDGRCEAVGRASARVPAGPSARSLHIEGADRGRAIAAGDPLGLVHIVTVTIIYGCGPPTTRFRIQRDKTTNRNFVSSCRLIIHAVKCKI
jgi:hypothetical protein